MPQHAYASPKPIHMDPHRPVLLNSPKLELSIEQIEYIRFILNLCSSDSRFAQKAADAMIYVLTNGTTPIPQINSINPTTAALGAENFELHVLGERFDEGAQIVWNGGVEPTSQVGEGELTTMVNMDTAQVAAEIPVQVQNPNGTISEPKTFSLTDPTASGTKRDLNPNFDPNVQRAEKEVRSNQAPPPRPPEVPTAIRPEEKSVSQPKK